MEKGNRVQEIRRRFEVLNSQNNDSSLSSQRQLSSDQVSIIPRTVKKPSESDPHNGVKGGIKRSHAFRSDKSKVKPICGNFVSSNSQNLGEGHRSINSIPASNGESFENKYKLNILRPPNIPTLRTTLLDVGRTNKPSIKPEVISDTLKKALKNPLPPGPAPKKPPRTFAHAGKSKDLEDGLKERKLNQTLSKIESANSNENNIPHRHLVALSQRSKTEPHIMLKKLESALLSNQVNKNFVNTKRDNSLSSLTIKKLGSQNPHKTSSLGAKSLCLNGFSSCINRNIYDTPFEYKSHVNSDNLKSNKITSLPPKGISYGKILKKVESSHIYEEPYSPRSEKKVVSEIKNERPVISPSKPSVHYMSSPIREARKFPFKDVIITVSPARPKDEQIKMITDAFNDNQVSNSDTESSQEETTSNHEEVTAVRKIYAQRVSSMRRQTSYVVKRNNLFEALLLIGIDQDLRLGKVPYIKSKYPDSAELAPGLPELVFPDAEDWPPAESLCLSRQQNNYTLTLTDVDGSRKYAYCRRLQPEGTPFCLPLAYVLITVHKDNVFYYSILAELELRHGTSEVDHLKFTDALYHSNFPKAGYNVKIGDSVFHRAIEPRKESYDISTLLRGATIPVFIKIFSTLLLERKVILIGSNISVVSACIEGLQKALFPFEWEFTVVDVVPKLELVEAPTPFLMGVIRPKQVSQSASFLPLKAIGECFVADIESGEVLVSYGDEGSLLPPRMSGCLRSALYLCPVHGNDVSPSEALIRLFVELVGHYNNHVITNVHTNTRTFQRDTFVKAPKSRHDQSFLEWFSETAMFQSFIQKRLSRSFEPGLFEQRCAEYIEENVKNHNISKKEKSLNKTVKIIGDRFKDWTSSA